MSERWVKAMITIGDETGPVWLNMARAAGLWSTAEGTRLVFEEGITHPLAKEPPEHFLPPGASRDAQAWAFILHLAAIPEKDAASPSIVREAVRIRDIK